MIIPNEDLTAMTSRNRRCFDTAFKLRVVQMLREQA